MPKKKVSNSQVPEALPTVMIHKDNLYVDTKNVQKQDRATFHELCENIKENGFDENLVVRPHPDKPGGFMIVSGNHRYRGGCKVGMIMFPCTVHEEWTEIDGALQGVRRNYGRGQLDKAAFTLLTDDLQEQGLALDAIQAGFGFGSDVDAFADMYQAQAEIAKEEKEHVERIENNNAEKVRLIENLELIVSHIYEEYGDTLSSSFVIMPVGGRKHMFIQATNALRNMATKIAGLALEKDMDLSLVLTGLLTVGLHHSGFGQDSEKLKDANDSNISGTDSDFDKINND